MEAKMAQQVVTTTITKERKKKKKKRIPYLDTSNVDEIPALKKSGGRKKQIS